MRLAAIIACFALLLGCSSGTSPETSASAAEKPAVAEQTSLAAASPAAETAKPDLSAGDPQMPYPAKPLAFKTADGKQIKLSDYKGKVVLVMFFSTDCPHCQRTTAFLSTIYDKYHANGAEFMALAVNPNAPANIGEFISTYRVKFPTGLTTRSTWAEFGGFPITQNSYVPHMMFVDKQGNVAEDHPGKDRDFWLTQQTSIPESLDRLLAK